MNRIFRQDYTYIQLDSEGNPPKKDDKATDKFASGPLAQVRFSSFVEWAYLLLGDRVPPPPALPHTLTCPDRFPSGLTRLPVTS